MSYCQLTLKLILKVTITIWNAGTAVKRLVTHHSDQIKVEDKNSLFARKISLDFYSGFPGQTPEFRLRSFFSVKSQIKSHSRL